MCLPCSSVKKIQSQKRTTLKDWKSACLDPGSQIQWLNYLKLLHTTSL